MTCKVTYRKRLGCSVDHCKMFRKLILIQIFIVLISEITFGQVRIRLFSGRPTESVLFTVTGGTYEIDTFERGSNTLTKGEQINVSRFSDKIAVKTSGAKGFLCDSLAINSTAENGTFSLRIISNDPVKQYYSGNLNCYSDLGTLLMINECDIEKYIAGVVMAEGGTGQNHEYFKTQAIIVRTYMYKYFDKHTSDGYNLCDNTHCQAFNGISTDQSIVAAAKETHDLVILDSDNILITAPFHSNCGGETSTSENVWLAKLPYLKKVIDPYCLKSRNAIWRKSMSADVWTNYLKRSGYAGKPDELASFNFVQNSRLTEYHTGSFTLPLKTIRTDLNLRSSFFSIKASGDSIILSGRGYGHGVGLCQEGAMVMASKGFDYKQIIGFYYSDVKISDIKNTVFKPPTTLFSKPQESVIIR